MSRVFVVNQPLPRRSTAGFSYDVSPAMQYGEIRFVFTADYPSPSVDPQGAIKHANAVLEDITEDDYIVWAGGDPLGMVIVAGIVTDLLDGQVRYLKWERARDDGGERTGGGYYVPMLINTFSVTEQEND